MPEQILVRRIRKIQRKLLTRKNLRWKLRKIKKIKKKLRQRWMARVLPRL